MATANLQVVTPLPQTRPQVAAVTKPAQVERDEAERDDFRDLVKHAAGHTYQTVLTSLPILVADLASLSLITLVTGLAISLVVPGFFAHIAWAALVIPVSFVCLSCLFGAYPGVGQNPIVEFRQCSISITTIFAILFVTIANSYADAYYFLIAWSASLVLNYVFRSLTRKYASNTKWWRQPAIVFGDFDTAKRLCDSFDARPELGLRPVGHVDPAICDLLDELGAEEAVANEKQAVFWAIVAQPEKPTAQADRMFARARRRFPQVLVVPAKSDLPSLWSGNKDCGGTSAVHIVERLLLPGPQLTKRVLDLALTVIGGLILMPVILGLILAVRLSSKGPIFYSQKRLGRGARHFQAWKFRTMVANADEVLAAHLAANPELRAEWEQDHKLKNDPRVTWIGKILRKTSVDELPQLWNVLKGEMSLVGPRPIVDSEINKYGETFSMYKRVIPGISGLWQVSGRNNTTYDERVGFDSYYVRNWSPWFDLYILLRTVKVVVLRDGAY